MLGNDIQIKQLIGVGDVHLSFQPDQRVYCLIGENGIGKTKCLEALFKAELMYNKQYVSRSRVIPFDDPQGFNSFSTNSDLNNRETNNLSNYSHEEHFIGTYYHNLPVVFLGAQDRGGINNKQKTEKEYLKSHSDDGIGSKRQRTNEYFDMINQHIEHRNIET